MRKRQHQQHNRFRNRPHHTAGRDVDGDAVFGAGGQIDVVVTDSAAADGAEARNSRERMRRDLRLERDQHVEPDQLVGEYSADIRAETRARFRDTPSSSDKPMSGNASWPSSSQKSAEKPTRNAPAVLDLRWRGLMHLFSSTTTQSRKMGISGELPNPLASGVTSPMGDFGRHSLGLKKNAR